LSARNLQGPVLVTGAAGMLGSQLLLTAPDGVVGVGSDLAAATAGPEVALVGVDLTDADQVEDLLSRVEPVGVIHAAAYTAVDRAEEEEALARRVNADATENLARFAAARALPLVIVSTDFVFDGTKGKPYAPADEPSPIGAYGRTKLEGEVRALAAHPDGVRIVRTQWLYGPRGAHFPGTMLRLARERDELKVVADQIGAPTSTLELAPALWDVLAVGEAGIYHGACEGQASWYDLAVATLELAGSPTRVVPCTTEEFPRPAPRPRFSVLDCSSLTALRGRPLAPWRTALADFLAQDGKTPGEGR